MTTVSEIFALAQEIEKLRAFIKSIDEDWVAFEPAEQDEWNDGYEDCLADMAAKARNELARSMSA